MGARFAAAAPQLRRTRPARLPIARGRRLWPGLTADRDLRWRALLRLSAAGQRVDELLSAELSADPSDAALRRPARPQAGAKERAWRRIFGDDHSLPERCAVMAGFLQHGQQAVLTPYAERYFTVLEHLWNSAGPRRAIAATRGLYPLLTHTEQEVLARIDELVTRGRLPEELLSVLVAMRAELATLLAARARDAAHAVG